MSFFYLAHLGRGFEKEPKFVSGLKIAFCTISFTGYMLFIMYESYLSASIIVKNTGRTFNEVCTAQYTAGLKIRQSTI
jgi:hypothetical protein